MGRDGKWERMKKACLETTEEVCGCTKGPQRHKETWWCNEDVRVALDNKKDCFKAWLNSKSADDKAT
jgi:hypothetical protein